MSRATETQKRQAAALHAIAKQLEDGYHPPAHQPGQRDALMLLRAGLAMWAEGDRAEQLAHDWSGRGFASPTTDPPVSGGTGGDPTSGAAGTSDHWQRRHTQLQLLRRLLVDNARSYESDVADTCRVRDNEGRRSSIIDCANPRCENTMTGIGDDRPKRGRCPRCYTHLQRHDIDWPHRSDHESDAAVLPPS